MRFKVKNGDNDVELVIRIEDDGAAILAIDDNETVLLAKFMKNGTLYRYQCGEEARKKLGFKVTQEGRIMLLHEETTL